MEALSSVHPCGMHGNANMNSPRVKKVLYSDGNVVCAMALDATNTRKVGAKMLMMPPTRNMAIFRKKTGLLPILERQHGVGAVQKRG